MTNDVSAALMTESAGITLTRLKEVYAITDPS